MGQNGMAQPLFGALTEFINLLLRGECPPVVRPVLFGGNMIAVNKESGGLRPIAVGYVWRRLAAKCANSYTISKLSSNFVPLQPGSACPAVVLDFTNAFNSLRHDVMMDSVHEIIHEFCPSSIFCTSGSQSFWAANHFWCLIFFARPLAA